MRSNRYLKRLGLQSGKLSVSDHGGKFLVHYSSLASALRKKHFIEFDSKEEAEAFISKMNPGAENQIQAETSGDKMAVYKYSGTILNPGAETPEYSGTMERVS
jgi:hypothetical protein